MKRHATNFEDRTPLIASSTLSSTVSLGNRLVIWNVRAIPSAVRRWLGHLVTSRLNSTTCPEVAGKIPVIKLNRVVLPAPFGPMMALRSPGMILSVTSRTARKPPKLFESARSSRTGSRPFACASVFTSMSLPIASEATGAPETEPRPMAALVAEFAGREVAAVDRRLEELVFAELPELADVRISLDDGVPKLLLVVAEHLLLLDLLDVDVLHRIAHLVDGDGTAQRIQLQRGDLLHEF